MPASFACALCGAPARAPFRPPPAEQAPDLDLRPGEPTRSTLKHWVMTCYCGASAPDVSILPQPAAAIVRTPDYAALRGSAPGHAFLRWSLIAAGLGRMGEAAEAALHAAWALDDLGVPGERDAAAARARAIALWPAPASPEDALRQIDVMRRAGQFEAARQALDRLPPAGDSTAALAAFQQARIEAEDARRYGMSSALRPPARRPHVAHGRTARPSFWQRLAGK